MGWVCLWLSAAGLPGLGDFLPSPVRPWPVPAGRQLLSPCRGCLAEGCVCRPQLAASVWSGPWHFAAFLWISVASSREVGVEAGAVRVVNPDSSLHGL